LRYSWECVPQGGSSERPRTLEQPETATVTH